MKKVIEVIREAESKGTAIGHFNISTLDQLWGIYGAAKNLDLPIVIGLSEGEGEFVGMKQAALLVKDLRESNDYPIYVNADHSYSVERLKEAVEAGFDMVIFDGAKLSHEENTAKTKEAVGVAKAINPDVLVEAEVGYIGSSSKMLDELPEGATVGADAMPSGEEVKKFVEETGVDLISPAVGNIHGMLKKGANPQLHIDKIKEIREAAGVPLVLHGGSGVTDENFKEAIAAGISMIHINTEIRKAWADAVRKFLDANPDEVAPYKILKPAMEATVAKVEERLKLFGVL